MVKVLSLPAGCGLWLYLKLIFCVNLTLTADTQYLTGAQQAAALREIHVLGEFLSVQVPTSFEDVTSLYPYPPLQSLHYLDDEHIHLQSQ